MSRSQPLVSIIIPVYNCEEYLERCLDSIFRQTYSNLEVITIDDGSSDASLSILREYAKKYSNMTVMSHKNHGQGFTRNKALNYTTGEYVLFVDSDDFIEALTVELALARITKDKSDFVHFDWKYSSLHPDRPNTYYYLNKEPYAHKRILEGTECDELLQMTHFFSVNNLYRKSFLDKYNIRYGENRIYEDNIFVVLTANRAKKISLLHSPLYIVQRNMSSSTRSKSNDDIHYKSFIRAVSDSLEVFKPRTRYSNYYLIKYFQTKFVFYYIKRVPRRYKTAYLKEYVDVVGSRTIDVPDNGQPDRIMRLSLKYGVFKNRNYKLFATIILIKTQILVRRDKVVRRLKRTKRALDSVLHPDVYSKYQKDPIDENLIVFLGFDYRYTGNSRYFFESMLYDRDNEKYTIKFITDDESVNDTIRVSPNSDEFYQLIAKAKYIVAESWIPRFIKKRAGMVWLQLWHGTPTKRMLFDSNEAEIINKQRSHKINKYRDILNWDYLIVDSEVAAEKFKSAFLYPESRMIFSGYPRVKFLIDSKYDEHLKKNIKKKVGLDERLMQKSIVLYTPTWRDYNYGIEQNSQDFSYIMDIHELSKVLGDEYLIFYHDHHYLSQFAESLPANCIDVSVYEVQDLLLVADHLVSDYSSIVYDAFAIELPVSLFVNDFEKYQKSRGVYSDIWSDLESLVVDNESDLADRITSVVNHDSLNIPSKYIYAHKESIQDILFDR